MDIKGIVKSGSYKNCIVSIQNEAYLDGDQIRFLHDDDICKFNVKILKKSFDSKGKKKVGEFTYLSKTCINIFSLCKCSYSSCCLSHNIEFKPESKPESKPEFKPESKPEFNQDYKFEMSEISEKIEQLMDIFKNRCEIDSILPIYISYKTMEKECFDMSYLYTFIRVSCLSIRVLFESFCKNITNNQVLTVRDLSKLAFTLGYFSHEKLAKSDDLLSTCNRVVHSVENVKNPSYYIKKINTFLSFIIDL
jgi:hypothetical protein